MEKRTIIWPRYRRQKTVIGDLGLLFKFQFQNAWPWDKERVDWAPEGGPFVMTHPCVLPIDWQSVNSRPQKRGGTEALDNLD